MLLTETSETLRTGETLQIECVLAPCADRAALVLPFLGHKPGYYRAHIESAFSGTCDALETRFYVGLINGEMVGNVMTVEANGVGILGHVHTRADQRRKGICHAIMAHQMDDFRARDGHALLLGTGYDSPPYHIYHHFGFRDLPGGDPGTMRYLREDEPDFLDQFFAPAATRIGPAGWQHWPLIALLAASPAPAYLRSLTLDAWGVTSLEGPYCRFMAQWGNSARASAVVLESETGAVLALATLTPQEHWRDVLQLDVFAEPRVEPARLADLVAALPPRPGKTVCFADPHDDLKVKALESLGFLREATLPRQFREADVWRDTWLYARHTDVPS